MTDFAPALARLQLAIDQSDTLQRGLSRRQDELLEVEADLPHLSAAGSGQRVMIDQAEDVRRAIRRHVDLGVSELGDALVYTRAALIDGRVQEDVPLELGRVLLHMVDRAVREGERAAASLDGAAAALAQTAQALPSQSDFHRTARQSIDDAAGFLESARRSVFRVSEDLPTLVEAIRAVAVAEDATSLDRALSRDQSVEMPARGDAPSHERHMLLDLRREHRAIDVRRF